MRVPRYSDSDVHSSGNTSPDETRYALSPATHDLHCQADRVDVRAVVRDNGEGEEDQAELSEAAKRREENSCKETTATRSGVAIHISIVAIVDSSRAHNRNAEHFGEEEREHEANEDSQENFGAGLV